MAGIGVERDVVGLVAFSEADQIGREHAEASLHQRRDHLAIEERPARLAMEQQDGRGIARPLVDVMLASLKAIAEVNLEPVLGKRIVRNAGKAFGGRAQDLQRFLLPSDRRSGPDSKP